MLRFSRGQKPRHQVACELSGVTRAALVLYAIELPGVATCGGFCDSGVASDRLPKAGVATSISEPHVYALFGNGFKGLTSLGGRISPRETWLDCLVRELKEETRDILDYTYCKDIFLSSPAQTINFDNCAYVFYPTTLETLRRISEDFPKTSSTRAVCNEMRSLEVINIDALIINLQQSMITDRPQEDTTSTQVNEAQTAPRDFPSAEAEHKSTTTNPVCVPEFQSMFITVGYDILKNILRENYPGQTFLGRNCITRDFNMEVNLATPVNSLPPVICLTPINHGLPVIYGTTKDGLYITDQFYLEEKSRRLFRSGWHPIPS